MQCSTLSYVNITSEATVYCTVYLVFGPLPSSFVQELGSVLHIRHMVWVRGYGMHGKEV